MDSSNDALITLLVGVTAALSTFHHYFAAEGAKRKSVLFISLLVVSIGTQVITQANQYHNAVMTRREQDHRTSDALYAFNQTDEQLLLKVADPKMSDANPYILGYWYFKRGYYEYLTHGNTDLAKKYLNLAKTYLNLAIHNKRFLPHSYYLLATINRTTQSDWSEAGKDYDLAIYKDPEYGAAYYGRAILYAQSNNLDGALNDLERATTFSVISCWDLRDSEEQSKIWQKIKDLDRYHRIADECGARFGLLSPAQAAPHGKAANMNQATDATNKR